MADDDIDTPAPPSDPAASTDPATPIDAFGLQIMDESMCLAHLGSTTVGRLGYLDGDQPVILPVNITLWDGHIAFRTAPGSKLAAAVMSRPVAVEVDAYDEDEHAGWSVLVKGDIEVVTDGREIASLDRLGALPWSRPDLRHTWVRVRSREITGRCTVPDSA